MPGMTVGRPTIARLIDDLSITPVAHADLSLVPTDLTEDSRRVTPGCLFVARKGRKHDGGEFARAALDAGAAAILTDDPQLAHMLSTRCTALVATRVPEVLPRLAERFFGEPGSRLSLVAATGTNGKSTIVHLVRAMINGVGERAETPARCGLIGTIETDDGEARARSLLTTPMPIDLSRALARMVERGCTHAALETSSHGLAQGRVDALRFDIAIFTNLTGDHLDEHGTMENYADAKAILFRTLHPEAAAIVNADSPWGERMVADCLAPLVRCRMHGPRAHDADATAEVLDQSVEGQRVALRGPWGVIETTTPMLGAHNAMNLLQAFAACHRLGFDAERLGELVPSIDAPTGRLQRVRVDARGANEPGAARSLPAVFIDYAHTDDALAKALEALRPLLGSGRLWCVFGCGGDRDATKRPRMGRVAGRLSDVPVLTSDNPRSEDPMRIAEDVIAGFDEDAASRAIVRLDRGEAIELAVHLAGPEDIVLIAGKGHETSQLLPDDRGGVRSREFVDETHARAALESRGRVRSRARSRRTRGTA